MTTALFLLRCVEVGISIRDLDLLTIGMVLDIFVEKWNDNIEENRNTGFVRMAQQADFDILTVKDPNTLYYGSCQIWRCRVIL